MTLAEALTSFRYAVEEARNAVRAGDKQRALDALQRLNALIQGVQDAVAAQFGNVTVHVARGLVGGFLNWLEGRKDGRR